MKAILSLVIITMLCAVAGSISFSCNNEDRFSHKKEKSTDTTNNISYKSNPMTDTLCPKKSGCIDVRQGLTNEWTLEEVGFTPEGPCLWVYELIYRKMDTSIAYTYFSASNKCLICGELDEIVITTPKRRLWCSFSNYCFPPTPFYHKLDTRFISAMSVNQKEYYFNESDIQAYLKKYGF